jgi:hypothetical protein
MSALGYGFNRSMQHLDSDRGAEGVVYEVPDENSVHRDRQGIDVGALATDIQVYFCDPQQPWQRGSNENTDGLLRQYPPKGMDLSSIHQSTLTAIARRLIERPRETLNFETPAERFGQCVASIG